MRQEARVPAESRAAATEKTPPSRTFVRPLAAARAAPQGKARPHFFFWRRRGQAPPGTGNSDPGLALEGLFRFAATVFDLHDHGASGHSLRVADYSVELARQMGVGKRQQERIRRAAMIHEVAKAGMSSSLLEEEPFLRAEDWQTLSGNAVLVAQLLNTIPSLRDLSPIMRHLRERWDGSGYPDRLEHDAIPIESRIIALCDTVDTIARGRPYHHTLFARRIASQLVDSAGKQFDPAVVRAFFASSLRPKLILKPT